MGKHSGDLMATLGELLSGGQKRRQWLDQTIGDLMEYYTPPNLRPAAEFVAQMNPIQGMADSMQQGGIALDPSQTPAARKKAALNSIVEGLIAVAPAAVASRGYMTPAQGTMESLLGWSPAGQQIADDLGRFVVDEAGNIRVPLPKPRNEAEAMARDILELRAAGRASEVTDDMMAKADPQYMFKNTPLDMSQEARMARAEEMGFDTGTPLYHGSVRDFQEFIPSERGKIGPGVYLTPSERKAGIFSGYEYGPNPRLEAMLNADSQKASEIYPVVTTNNPAPMDVRQAARSEASAYDDRIGAYRDAFGRGGYDGVSVEDERTILNPSNIRSRFARFDPAFKHLANLSAGTIGALLGLNQIQAQQNPQGGM